MRGATSWDRKGDGPRKNFNPRSSCEERHCCRSDRVPVTLFQSTLLMRGATVPRRACTRARYFNPRSSCEERPKALRGLLSINEFQSTLLMRGATAGLLRVLARHRYFNPRSSCEERRFTSVARRAHFCISIHAPHARSDAAKPTTKQATENFNPRSSCEERLSQPCFYL